MSVLRAILRAVHRTCFVRARRDAPPLADVVAALVDGVPFPERGAPPALVTVFGRPMVVPAADDDDDASDDEFRLTTSEDGEVDAVREGFRPRTESSTTPLLPDKSSFANGEDQTENRNDARATVPPPTKAWDASATDSGFELLVRALDDRNAVRAACAVAEERRVVLRSKNDALLVSASMALTRTLRPLRWRHAFFPLLPIALVSATLEKPGPFIVGIKADFVVPTAVLENAVVVDLDANDVRVFENAARGQQGSVSRDGGFPRAFAEPLLADLRRLASREPPNAADVETSLDENENENERTLPEWARIAAHAAAARAAARGQRWSAHHDDAVLEDGRKRRGVQVINLAVTKIVLQQLGHLHVIAKGHAVEPRRQGFAFPGSRMQWPVWRWLHISSRSNCRRRSLGPVYSAMLSVRWLIASSPLSTAATAAAINRCASSPMVPSLRVSR